MKNRFLSILTVFILSFAMMSVAAFAEDEKPADNGQAASVGEQTAADTDFSKDWKELKNQSNLKGGKYYLTQNRTIKNLEIQGKTTIHLNGHSLRGTQSLDKAAGTLTISKDAHVELIVDKNQIHGTVHYGAIDVNGHLNLEGVDVTNAFAPASAPQTNVIVGNGGTFVLSGNSKCDGTVQVRVGGTLSGMPNCNYNNDVTNHGLIKGSGFFVGGKIFNNGTIDCNGGSITIPVTNNGRIENGMFRGEVINEPKGVITGGRFTGTLENNGTIEDSAYVTVKFDSNGGSQVPDQRVVKGQRAVRPADPVKSGSRFAGWNYNGRTYEFTESVILNETHLLAIWDDNASKVGVSVSPSAFRAGPGRIAKPTLPSSAKPAIPSTVKQPVQDQNQVQKDKKPYINSEETSSAQTGGAAAGDVASGQTGTTAGDAASEQTGESAAGGAASGQTGETPGDTTTDQTGAGESSGAQSGETADSGESSSDQVCAGGRSSTSEATAIE